MWATRSNVAENPALESAPGWFHDRRAMFAIMGAGAGVATLALAVLSVQGYRLGLDPDAANAGEMWGFPSAFLGLALAPVALTIAVAGFAGVRPPRWNATATVIGTGLGVGYGLWLAIQAAGTPGGMGPWHLAVALASLVTFGAAVRLLRLGPSEFEPTQPDGEPSAGWRHDRRVLFAVMGLSAIVCTVASAVLSVEAYHLAVNPGTSLACDISAALSCGKVAMSWQAQVFGFPNAFIGLATEPVVLTIAVAGLSGVRFPRWFMFSAQIGYSLGLIFAYWLFYQSFVNIGALCPWCLTITVFTTVTFFTMLHLNVQEKNLHLSPSGQAALEKSLRLGLDLVIPALLIVGIFLAIVIKYGPQLF